MSYSALNTFLKKKKSENHLVGDICQSAHLCIISVTQCCKILLQEPKNYKFAIYYTWISTWIIIH